MQLIDELQILYGFFKNIQIKKKGQTARGEYGVLEEF